jgi:hypothetical protein
MSRFAMMLVVGICAPRGGGGGAEVASSTNLRLAGYSESRGRSACCRILG